MLCEFRIVSQPPESIDGENKVRGAKTAQLFQVQNYLLAVARGTSVNAVFFQEMPALALCIIKYRWVAHIRGTDQRSRRRTFVKFQASMAKLSGAGFAR